MSRARERPALIVEAAVEDGWVALYFLQSTVWYFGGVRTAFNEELAGRYGEEGGPGGCIPLPTVSGTGLPWPVGAIDGIGKPDEMNHMYAMGAAIFQLNRWVRDGVPPPEPPRVLVDAAGTMVRDADGNAIGGLRQPIMDVPVATYRGDHCFLFGSCAYPDALRCFLGR